MEEGSGKKEERNEHKREMKNETKGGQAKGMEEEKEE